MEFRKQPYLLVFIFSITVFITLGISIGSLYQIMIEGQEDRLMEMARSQARLLEEFSQTEENTQKGTAIIDEDQTKKIVGLFKSAQTRMKYTTDTGEFILAKKMVKRSFFYLRMDTTNKRTQSR